MIKQTLVVCFLVTSFASVAMGGLGDCAGDSNEVEAASRLFEPVSTNVENTTTTRKFCPTPSPRKQNHAIEQFCPTPSPKKNVRTLCPTPSPRKPGAGMSLKAFLAGGSERKLDHPGHPLCLVKGDEELV